MGAASAAGRHRALQGAVGARRPASSSSRSSWSRAHGRRRRPFRGEAHAPAAPAARFRPAAAAGRRERRWGARMRQLRTSWRRPKWRPRLQRRRRRRAPPPPAQAMARPACGAAQSSFSRQAKRAAPVCRRSAGGSWERGAPLVAATQALTVPQGPLAATPGQPAPRCSCQAVPSLAPFPAAGRTRVRRQVVRRRRAPACPSLHRRLLSTPGRDGASQRPAQPSRSSRRADSSRHRRPRVPGNDLYTPSHAHAPPLGRECILLGASRALSTSDAAASWLPSLCLGLIGLCGGGRHRV